MKNFVTTKKKLTLWRKKYSEIEMCTVDRRCTKVWKVLTLH